jgi:hypothetical protein
MLEFERALRRADIALGGDGAIGLPYWDWTEAEVNGEVLPGIVREKLMVAFPADFFPKEVTSFRRSYEMGVASDASLKSYFGRGSLAKAANDCLRSVVHAQHACTDFSTPSNPTVESPHNSIHGVMGGMMGSYQSSFHPSFWLHHCNVDRLYEGYLALEPDSAAEFEAHQKSMGDAVTKEPGYPDGPWGRYLPFKHFKTGDYYHASQTFDTKALGYAYDVLPTPAPLRMREMPFYAIFAGLDLKVVEAPVNLHVYVSSGEWAPPADTSLEALLDHAGYAGSCSVFFLDTPAKCSNCEKRAPFDEYLRRSL